MFGSRETQRVTTQTVVSPTADANLLLPPPSAAPLSTPSSLCSRRRPPPPPSAPAAEASPPPSRAARPGKARRAWAGWASRGRRRRRTFGSRRERDRNLGVLSPSTQNASAVWVRRWRPFLGPKTLFRTQIWVWVTLLEIVLDERIWVGGQRNREVFFLLSFSDKTSPSRPSKKKETSPFRA